MGDKSLGTTEGFDSITPPGKAVLQIHVRARPTGHHALVPHCDPCVLLEVVVLDNSTRRWYDHKDVWVMIQGE